MITGSEDGALSVMGGIMMVLSWMGFTLPPECTAYWVGEVGQPTSQEEHGHDAHGQEPGPEPRLYARLLKAHPKTSLPVKAVCCEAHAGLEAPVRG